MRQHQRRRIEHQRIVKQEIEVDGSRSPAFRALAAQAVLDALQAAQQSVWLKRSFRPKRAVEKTGLLRRPANRRRFAPRTDRGNRDLRLPGQLGHCGVESCLPVPFVRPQTDQADGHGG